MASAELTEFSSVGVDGMIQAPRLRGAKTQTVSFTVSTRSVQLDSSTRLVLIHSATKCYAKAGDDAVEATTADAVIRADKEQFFEVKGGDYIAFYDGTS